jgi:hypothetical protein
MARLSTGSALLNRPGTAGASGGAGYLKGMETVMSNLNKEIEGIKVKSMGGLIMAAAHIRQKTNDEGNAANLTPVDKGNLNASWFVVTATATPYVKGPKTFSSDSVGSEVKAAHSGVVEQARGQVASMTTANRKFLMMGYSANYAGFVHEFIDPAINWNRIGSNAKWLQNTIYENKEKIVQIVKNESQIKK